MRIIAFLVFLGNTANPFVARTLRGIEAWAAQDTRASGTFSAPSTFSFGYVTLAVFVNPSSRNYLHKLVLVTCFLK